MVVPEQVRRSGPHLGPLLFGDVTMLEYGHFVTFPSLSRMGKTVISRKTGVAWGIFKDLSRVMSLGHFESHRFARLIHPSDPVVPDPVSSTRLS